MRGRPREFDRTDALERAMEVFWKRGYEAASVQSLVDGMKINRGSLYVTFGDKRSLFLEAIDHYQKAVVTDFIALLDADGSPRVNIRTALEHVAQLGGGRLCRGCMLTNTAVEEAPHDAEIARAVRDALGAIERAFARAIERGVAAGEIAPTKNRRALARFLLAAMQGLVVMGKARMNRSTLADVINETLSTLD
jgi:TetR/AcrR family transcriptional regulator, transcriptional repressor for nem operon